MQNSTSYNLSLKVYAVHDKPYVHVSHHDIDAEG